MRAKTFIPAILIGAVFGLAIGFTVHRATTYGTDNFTVWVSDVYSGYNYDSLFWTLGGVIVAAAIVLILAKN
jgi:hypothetical protein